MLVGGCKHTCTPSFTTDMLPSMLHGLGVLPNGAITVSAMGRHRATVDHQTSRVVFAHMGVIHYTIPCCTATHTTLCGKNGMLKICAKSAKLPHE